MDTNAAGIDLIKEFEGLKLKAYFCPAGVPTIGYGHTKTVTAQDVRSGRTITEAEAERLLKQDLKEFESGVLQACTNTPNENQFSAMVSLAFNIGIAGFRRSSVLRNHNANDDDAAARSFGLWNKATVNGKKVELRGLTRRRAAEAALYLKEIEVVSVEQVAVMPQAVEPEKPMTDSTIVRGASLAGVSAATAAVAEISKNIETITSSFGTMIVPALLIVVVALSGYIIHERLKQRKRGWA